MAIITWNPNDKGANISLSNNNLTVSKLTSTTSWNAIRSSLTNSTNKHLYWEIKIDLLVNNGIFIGVGNINQSLSDFLMVNSIGIYSLDGKYYNNGWTSYSLPLSQNDIIGVALNLENKTIRFSINGIPYSDIDINFITGNIYPMVSLRYITGITANFGASPFEYEMPSGYSPYDIENASWFMKTKYLIQNKINNNIYTLNTDGDIILSSSQTINENNYIQNGFNTLLNVSQLMQLKNIDNVSNFKILMYTDNIVITSAILNYNCENYKPMDNINDQFNIIMCK